jgi:hypothetical protein
MEIFNNSIIRLIFRQGGDNERKQIVFKSGEPAWASDSERLFVGNGYLSGGKVAGNLFLGSGNDITTFSPGVLGDTAYNSDTKTLFRIKQNDGSVLSDWEIISSPSDKLYCKYNGSLSAMEFSNGVTGVNLSTGHYKFTYSPFPTSNSYMPTSDIYGINPINTQSRVIYQNLSTCDVVVLSGSTKTDATVSLVINY